MSLPLSDNRTYIIAEAGVNHDGDTQKAHRLVEEAAKAGADAIKFQLFDVDEIVSKQSPLAEYQQKAREKSQYEMVKRLMLPKEEMRKLKEHAEEQNIDFMASSFDAESAQFLADLNVVAMKVPSGEITNFPFLKQVAALKIFSIISTGMSSVEEVARAIDLFKKVGTPFALLHCVSAYPAPVDQINLLAMDVLRETFNVPVGYSDHTEGIDVPLAAAALGAQILEKHFTLHKSDFGPDHAASLEPNELAAMVRSIRIMEQARGERMKQCQPCEENTRAVARRSIILTKAVQKGGTLTADMIAIKRPGTGLPPERFADTIGRKAAADLPASTVLTEELLS